MDKITEEGSRIGFIEVFIEFDAKNGFLNDFDLAKCWDYNGEGGISFKAYYVLLV